MSQFRNLKSQNDLDETNRDKEFTKNVLIIEIKDIELSYISIIDMPGLIQAHPKEEYIVGIRNLYISYLEKSNTILLGCLPLNDDLNNQEIYKLAKN